MQISRLKRYFSSAGLPWLALVLLAATAQAANGPPVRATPVKVAEVKRMLLAPQTWVAGTVISRFDAHLAAEVEGKLLSVAEVGAKVKKGDLIARTDDTFIKLTIEEYKAAVDSEQATLNFLSSEMQRLARLAQQNNAALTRLDEVKANQQVARSKLQIARTRLKQAQEESRRHSVIAPFDGVIVERYMQAGERAKVGEQVVRLIDTRSLEVQARIPLETLDYVREGDSLTVKTAQRTVTARVRALVAVGDERSRLLELRVSINGEGWTIGQPVRISLPTAAAQEVLAVPRDALVLRRDGAIVFRVNADNKAERLPVQLGVASGELMAVKGSLHAGDRVVVRGGERLRPGALVKVLGNGAPAGAGAGQVIKRDTAPGAAAKPAEAKRQP